MASPKPYTQEESKQAPAPEPHRLVSVEHILDTEYPPLQWIIPDLMPEGLTMLFSAPKVGKSIIALYISLRMALKKGTVGGHVIYLSLDDKSERRMQSRLRDLLQGEEISGGIDFVFKSEKIGKGLVEQLAMDLEARPDTKLVVIDVYAKVKPEGGNDIFKSDYDALEPLRTFAERNHIGILLIHHSRKRKDADDWLNEINGSTGLSAAVDTIWKLDRKRGTYDMRLFTTGRDTEDAILNLDINDLDADWLADADVEEEQDKGSVEPKIMNALLSFSPERPARCDVLATVTELKLSTVKVTMRRLLRQGKVEQPTRGGYHLPVTTKVTKVTSQNDHVTFVTLEDETSAPVEQPTRGGYHLPVTTKVTKVTSQNDHVTFVTLEDETSAPAVVNLADHRPKPHATGPDCVGKCLHRIAPKPQQKCGRCGHCHWRIVQHAGAPLYICQKCHPNWRSAADEEADDGQ